MNKIIRLPEVIKRTGLSRSSIYLRISQNLMPKPVSLGGRAVGWLESSIESWIQEQVNKSTESAN